MTITLHLRGDFFEADGNDALIVASVLGVTLTKRNGMSMCGIPYHRYQAAVRDLGEAGHDVDAVIPVQRGVEQGALVASASSAPERPVAARAAVKAHKRKAALNVSKQAREEG